MTHIGEKCNPGIICHRTGRLFLTKIEQDIDAIDFTQNSKRKKEGRIIQTGKPLPHCTVPPHHTQKRSTIHRFINQVNHTDSDQ